MCVCVCVCVCVTKDALLENHGILKCPVNLAMFLD